MPQGRGCKAKGSAAERELRNILRGVGFKDAERTPLSGAGYEKNDIARVHGLGIEVKRQERPAWSAWMKQVLEQTRPGDVPMIAWRKNRSPWWALVMFEPLAALLGRAERHRRLLSELAVHTDVAPELRRRILEELRDAAD